MANQVILTGRLTKDAELSFLPGTGMPKVTFILAVDRNYQKDKNNKKVDFIPVEMLGAHTEKLAQYVTKGKMIGITGELHIDQYEKDGQKKSFTKVNADRLEFLGGNSNTNTENKQSNEYKIEEFNDFDEDEIPF